MLTKSRKRGIRRWRSHCTWMRRLKLDQNQHGWKRDPMPSYYADGGSWKHDGTTLCNCFFIYSREAVRFKDTPHPTCSVYECDRRKSSHGKESRPIQEWRAMPLPEDYGDHGNRKRRSGMHPVKVTCRCGFYFETVMAQNGHGLSWSERWRDCDDCKKRKEARVYFGRLASSA